MVLLLLRSFCVSFNVIHILDMPEMATSDDFPDVAFVVFLSLVVLDYFQGFFGGGQLELKSRMLTCMSLELAS